MITALQDRQVTCVFGQGVSPVRGKVIELQDDCLLVDGKAAGVATGGECVHVIPYSGLLYIRLDSEKGES